jgi:hypothetical protein
MVEAGDAEDCPHGTVTSVSRSDAERGAQDVAGPPIVYEQLCAAAALRTHGRCGGELAGDANKSANPQQLRYGRPTLFI